MMSDATKVSILLATLNGARFLEEQLLSIVAQDHASWRIILSDDGSHDDTLAIAKSTIPASQIRTLAGPRTGLAQNFWNALLQVPDGEYAAFCDQDDVWRRCKLSRAIARLEPIKSAAAYASGRIVTNADLEIQHYQKRRNVGTFTHLLFRNQVAGNTCVLNPAAVSQLKRFAPPESVPFHDWWVALVLKAVGAQFIHDSTPTLYYRQHNTNVLGARDSRLQTILDGRYHDWCQSNFNALWSLRHSFTKRAQRTLRVCLPLRAGLSLTQGKDRLDHVRQYQQQTRRRSLVD